MSIQSEITRITNKRDASFVAVANKGVTVPAGSTIDDLPDLIDAIPSGGGSIIIQDTPDSHGGTIREITAQSVVKIQTKTATPTESQQTVSPDTGYDALSSVTVGAISPTYVGSGIDRNDVSDITRVECGYCNRPRWILF